MAFTRSKIWDEKAEHGNQELFEDRLELNCEGGVAISTVGIVPIKGFY